jgi:hypothetical protein
VAVSSEGDEPEGGPLPDGEKDVPREPKEAGETPLAERTPPPPPPAEQQKEEARAQKEPEQNYAGSEGFSLDGLRLGGRRRGHKRRNPPRWRRLFGG